jgi:phosphoribosylamine-glycine ligase
MRFLLIDDEGAPCSLAYQLQQRELHEVKMFSEKPEGREHLNGIVAQVQTIEQGLGWMGKNAYFIRGDEKDCSELRQRGYRGYGGNIFTERLENDRQFEMEIAQRAEISIPNFHLLENIDEGIQFIKDHPDQYCLKQMGHCPKTWNYVGHFADGSDVIDQLEWIKMQPEMDHMLDCPFMLQEFVEGIEIAVTAFWQYNDWLKDEDGNVILVINKEHKKEGDGDTGRTCGEMGTVAMFTIEPTKLFEETLAKLTPILRENAGDVCLAIDANCGVIDTGECYLYELTPRTGYPISALIEFLLAPNVGNFFIGLIEGNPWTGRWKNGWGVVTVLGSGQYPDEGDSHDGCFKDQPVRMEIDDHIAPFFIRWDEDKTYYRIADYYEYVAGVNYVGDDIIETNQKCVEKMQEIDVRAPHYRHDIGTKFVEIEIPELIKLGYL